LVKATLKDSFSRRFAAETGYRPAALEIMSESCPFDTPTGTSMPREAAYSSCRCVGGSFRHASGRLGHDRATDAISHMPPNDANQLGGFPITGDAIRAAAMNPTITSPLALTK
jgi:hypothetical protein